MAQGRSWNKEEVVQNLKPYFELGYSIKKACKLAEFNDSTIYEWLKEDPELQAKIKAWQGAVSASARRVVATSIVKDKNDLNAKWWLERVERNDFSIKTVQDKRVTHEVDLSPRAKQSAEKFQNINQEDLDYDEDEDTDV